MAGNVFSTTPSLSFLKLLQLSSITVPTFQRATGLTTLILSNCSAIAGTLVFASCYNLLSLYLLSTSVIPLSNINAFNSTPISTYTTSTGGVYGSIYVRASLLDSYKTATNWSTYSARMVGLTDAEVEAILTS